MSIPSWRCPLTPKRCASLMFGSFSKTSQQRSSNSSSCSVTNGNASGMRYNRAFPHEWKCDCGLKGQHRVFNVLFSHKMLRPSITDTQQIVVCRQPLGGEAELLAHGFDASLADPPLAQPIGA